MLSVSVSTDLELLMAVKSKLNIQDNIVIEYYHDLFNDWVLLDDITSLEKKELKIRIEIETNKSGMLLLLFLFSCNVIKCGK